MKHATGGSQVDPKTVWVVGLNVLAIVGSVWLVYQTRQVLSWILVALFIALALDPAVQWMVRKGLHRGVAILGLLVLAAAVVALLVATLIPIFVEQGRSFVTAAPDLLDRLQQQPVFQWADEELDLVAGAKSEIVDRAGSAAEPIVQLVGGIFTGILATITIVVLTVFMLLYGRRLLENGLAWVEPSKRPRYVMLSQRMQRAVAGYVNGALLIAMIGGIVTAVGTASLGVPYFLPLGLAMMILGLVPYIGTAVGVVFVVGTVFLAAGVKMGIIAAVIFVGYQQLENELLQPMIQRRTIKMNALLIAIVMLVGTALAGVTGALLSLPIAGAIQVVLQDVLERRKASWTPAPSSHDQLIIPASAEQPELPDHS